MRRTLGALRIRFKRLVVGRGMEVVVGARRAGINVSLERTQERKRIEWLIDVFAWNRQPDCVEPAFLCSACEADRYSGGRWMSKFWRVREDAARLQAVDRGLVTAMRPRPVQKSEWAELGIGKKTKGA